MKIAVTTSGDHLDAPVDPRFGRAPQFLIFDTETEVIGIKKNTQNLNAAQGAGIQSAMNVCEESVDCVITGNCGPKAYATLSAANVSVYIGVDCTVGEAIEKLKRGELEVSQEANVEGHWA
ncbi:MAG: NifB/NifX family molybdenum-iron cluster-binding protein [Pontiellaceae bacterium]|nr:NifB/NifX family molybdenum-iron cluster-binding protein [Pontiellaceae bacterium]MBN2783315.1 NifB/NifX family molybdenum-iron cluster-binding protein [Pontiellaceae bacterium]